MGIISHAKKAVFAAFVTLAAAAPALADPWEPTVVIDTAPVFTVAGVIITAAAGMWAIRKVIKTVNRS